MPVPAPFAAAAPSPASAPAPSPASATPGGQAARAGDDAALARAAEAFEALFLRQMLAAMRAAKLADDPLSSAAQGTFRDMSDARLADSMAAAMAASNSGIAALLRTQFAARKGPSA